MSVLFYLGLHTGVYRPRETLSMSGIVPGTLAGVLPGGGQRRRDRSNVVLRLRADLPW